MLYSVACHLVGGTGDTTRSWEQYCVAEGLLYRQMRTGIPITRGVSNPSDYVSSMQPLCPCPVAVVRRGRWLARIEGSQSDISLTVLADRVWLPILFHSSLEKETSSHPPLPTHRHSRPTGRY